MSFYASDIRINSLLGYLRSIKPKDQEIRELINLLEDIMDIINRGNFSKSKFKEIIEKVIKNMTFFNFNNINNINNINISTLLEESEKEFFSKNFFINLKFLQS